MRLLIVRHAAAVEAGTLGFSEETRPLTPDGEKKFRKAAEGLARVEQPPKALLTSPLVRARQTAQIASEAWGRPKPKTLDALATGRIEDVLDAVREYPDSATVAVFGHEPQLSGLLARLVGTHASERFAFKKGGAALVELEDGPEHAGRLIWFLPPGVLRELAGESSR
jgi:phosphohistidine phosphatase